MAVDYKKLKVGNKVRYLGGDGRDSNGELTVGEEYVIRCKDFAEDAYFNKNDEGIWCILDYNAHCFELVEDEGECNCDTIEVEAKDGVLSETICNRACKHDSHIVNLAKEVAELKRELTRIYDAVFESNEKHRRIEDDIVLLDERLIEVETKKPGEDKTQYVTVYGSEYIDKLFGGDSE